jgi:hypothetical protein
MWSISLSSQALTGWRSIWKCAKPRTFRRQQAYACAATSRRFAPDAIERIQR